MTALLSENQLKAVRKAALLGMVTDVIIERRNEAPPPVGGDYGDDFITYDPTTESTSRHVKGWFHSTPTPVQDVDTGMVVTANTYRLYLPVGTDVQVGDRIQVGSASYTVSDTTAESTWLPLLTCSLRKRD